jgi:hypothetical protein
MNERGVAAKAGLAFREACFEIKAALIGPQDFNVRSYLT